MSENKKIKNASPLDYKGISFKSKLEVTIYKTLTDLGYKVYYEPTKYKIWEGFKPSVPFYTKDLKTRDLKLDTKKVIDITYTPDFVTSKGDTVIIIEAKGFENDVYPYKKKLFRKYLEEIVNNTKQDILFFEIFSKKNLMEALQLINLHAEELKRNKSSDN